MTHLVEPLCYEFTGSIPNGVIGIFLFLNPSGRTGHTAALGSTQSLTEISTRGVSWKERRSVRRAENLPFHVLIV